MKIFVVTFFCLLMNISNSYSQKIFDRIRNDDVKFLKKFLNKPISSETIYKKLYYYDKTKDTTYVHSASIVEYAALKNAINCFKLLVENKEQIEKFVDFEYDMNVGLAWSIYNESKDIFKLTQDNGADVNYHCEICHFKNTGMLALHFLKYDFFLELLAKDYDLNSTDKFGNNLFHSLFYGISWSAKEDNYLMSLDKATKLIDLFLKRGVDINLKNKYGVSPIMISASINNQRFYKHVKELSNSINRSDTLEIITLLKYSLQYPKFLNEKSTYNDLFDKIIIDEKIVLSKEMIDKADLDNEYLLLESVKEDNYFVFQKLLKYKPNVNIENEFGEKSIYLAVIRREIDFCNELLDNGAEVDKKIISMAKINFPNSVDLIKKFKKAPKGTFNWELINR